MLISPQSYGWNGRPPYVPTDKDRVAVRSMTAYGMPGRKSAMAMGVGYTTLHKYYRQELDIAAIVELRIEVPGVQRAA